MTGPTYEWYVDEHRGQLDAEGFADALPLARARLLAMTGPVCDEDPRADAWMHAACALADRVAGLDTSGLVASETVGSTSLTWAAAAQASSAAQADYDAALPWLAGTGLLCRAVRCG